MIQRRVLYWDTGTVIPEPISELSTLVEIPGYVLKCGMVHCLSPTMGQKAHWGDTSYLHLVSVFNRFHT